MVDNRDLIYPPSFGSRHVRDHFQANPLSVEAGMRYRKEILLPGGERSEMESLTRFLGGAPTNEAFMRRLLQSYKKVECCIRKRGFASGEIAVMYTRLAEILFSLAVRYGIQSSLPMSSLMLAGSSPCLYDTRAFFDRPPRRASWDRVQQSSCSLCTLVYYFYSQNVPQNVHSENKHRPSRLWSSFWNASLHEGNAHCYARSVSTMASKAFSNALAALASDKVCRPGHASQR